MRRKYAQLLLFFLLSVFTFNMAVDCVAHHHQETSSYCCELNEVEELNEFGSRLRSFEPSDLILVTLRFDFVKNVLETKTSASRLPYSRAFFPNALHVPIYMGKCVYLI